MDTPENTPEQVAAHKANEQKAAVEADWSLFQVELSGDVADWEPRPDPTYWEFDEEKDQWVPLSEDKLPDGVGINSDTGKVTMKATATVTLRARDASHAEYLALKAEESAGYYKVESVKELDA
jgi:hypothetical protein